MEFTLASIHEAHKLYTGPEFPKLIREFKAMGMVINIYDLESGVVYYQNMTGERLEEKGIDALKVSIKSDYSAAFTALKRNQTGESDFPTFCKEIAAAGICKWVSDLEKMTCTYYDKQENAVIEESIPSA